MRFTKYKPPSMADPLRFVGRYAVLRSLVDAPDLNGSHALVKSFHVEDNTYEATVVDTGVDVLHLKLTNLKFYTDADFFDRCPKAREIVGIYTTTSFPSGAVVDFSRGSAPGETFDQHVEVPVDASCRVFGNEKTKTLFKAEYCIDVDKLGDVVEFENIQFEFAESLDCRHGHIIFRSCVFESRKGRITIDQDMSSQSSVTFENCTFSNQRSCCVNIIRGHAVFVQCEFSALGMGVVVASGSASIHYSSFKHCAGGVVVPNKGIARLNNCTFEKMVDFAVLASNGSNVALQKCTVDESIGDGIVVKGGDDTRCELSNCTIRACRTGVRMGDGQVCVEMHNTTFQQCKLGYYAAVDTTGSVTINASSYAEVIVEGICLGGNKCFVTVDGVDSYWEPRPSRLLNTRETLTSLGIKYGYPVSVKTKKVLNRMTFIRTTCAGCNAIPPAGAKFKKCAECEEARYCSKKCQRNHFRAHFSTCTVHCIKSKELAEDGHISCGNCGTVQMENRGVAFNGCSKCFDTFYCSRECQKKDWKRHKDDCPLYKRPSMLIDK